MMTSCENDILGNHLSVSVEFQLLDWGYQYGVRPVIQFRNRFPTVNKYIYSTIKKKIRKLFTWFPSLALRKKWFSRALGTRDWLQVYNVLYSSNEVSCLASQFLQLQKDQPVLRNSEFGQF